MLTARAILPDVPRSSAELPGHQHCRVCDSRRHTGPEKIDPAARTQRPFLAAMCRAHVALRLEQGNHRVPPHFRKGYHQGAVRRGVPLRNLIPNYFLRDKKKTCDGPIMWRKIYLLVCACESCTHRQILDDRPIFSEGSLRGGREAAKQVCPCGMGTVAQSATNDSDWCSGCFLLWHVFSFRAPDDGKSRTDQELPFRLKMDLESAV